MTGRHALAQSAAPVRGPRVRATGLRLTRGGRTILDGVDLDANSGEVLGVLGPSGSGKSSLLAVLGGLQPPDEGEVRLDDVRVDGPAPHTGVVLQSYGLVSLLSAAENVEVALQTGRPAPDAPEIRARAAAGLADLGLADVASHLVEDLSGGQQQRVALARALVTRPTLILADEVTAELDPVLRDRVVARLWAAADAGATVVLATHDEELASRCSATLRLQDGRVVQPVA